MKTFRYSIVVRSSAIVLGIAMAVGAVFAGLTYSFTLQWEREQVRTRMVELLNTVESTASIACFLMDQNLGAEVARGLLKNNIIRQVRIEGEGRVLAQAGAAGSSASSGSMVRAVVSPFNAQEEVCRIALEPNEAVIQAHVADRSRFIVYLLMLQAFALALIVAYLVLTLITRPIKRLSDWMHNLSIESGERPRLPNAERRDEIGRLAEDVNALLLRLANILGIERSLRLQREVEERKFRAIFENAGTGIFVADRNGAVQSCNRAFLRALGIRDKTPLERINGLLPDFLGPYSRRVRELIDEAVAGNRPVTEDFRIVPTKGRPARWISLVLNPIEEGLVQGLVDDITERKAAEENAYLLAATDSLTGLANRLGFDNELNRLTDATREQEHEFYLLMIDLDWFKQVNDTHGHDAGDTVLRHVAGVLRMAVREGDLVARLGGDEFVILLEAGNRHPGVRRVAEHILDEVQRPIAIGNGVKVRIGASIGIARSHGAASKAELLKHADEAMYRAKQHGRHQFAMYAADEAADEAADA